MRKAIYRGMENEGRAVLARAHAVHVATTNEAGAPILRTFHAVLDDDLLAFHAAPAGEKMAGLGRLAVASAEEVIASIPSWFIDPERACPATTYYLSAQAHGPLEVVEDGARKARILQQLMEKYQPEGGHVPLRHDDRLYTKAIDTLLVAGVRISHVDTKTKLGQNRSRRDRVRVIEQLWQRGGPGDVRAAAFLIARFPELDTPPFIRRLKRRLPEGMRLECWIPDDAIDDVMALLGEGAYWLATMPRQKVRDAVVRATARVGVRDASGRLVAFARAVSDGRVAWIYDVLVTETARNAGIGQVLMELLLDHPEVRRSHLIRLTTRDAMSLYRRLGFCELEEAPRHPWRSVEMVRHQGTATDLAAATPAATDQNVPPSPSPA